LECLGLAQSFKLTCSTTLLLHITAFSLDFIIPTIL
jgi:hypothetical protein